MKSQNSGKAAIVEYSTDMRFYCINISRNDHNGTYKEDTYDAVDATYYLQKKLIIGTHTYFIASNSNE